MGVERVDHAPLRAGRLRRRLAVAVSAAALAVLGLVSGGVPAQAALAAPTGGQAPGTAHKQAFPGLVHPAKPVQGVTAATSAGSAHRVVAGNQPTSPVRKPVYSRASAIHETSGPVPGWAGIQWLP